MDNRNSLLIKLASMIKSGHISVVNQIYPYKSFMLKHIKYENEHRDIVEHQFENPELFWDQYPYKIFEQDKVARLEWEFKELLLKSV